MNARFSSTGVTAGMRNSRQVLRMPPASATNDMKPMYGNITRVISTEAWKASGLSVKPVAIR